MSEGTGRTVPLVETSGGKMVCSPLQGIGRMIIFFRVIDMPRKARTKSITGIYHVMMRGINQQVIFEEDADRRFFLHTIKKAKETSGFQLYAFCLMSNHVHLLMKEGTEPLEIVFKRIGSGYVKWFNEKYQRTGHLFQDRFRSENVEDERYFMTVFRYILQNPVKGGLAFSPGRYRWSSYLAYEKSAGSITDREFAEEVFGGRDNLIAFCNENNDDTAMDENDYSWRIKDDQAIEIMNRISKCGSVTEFQALDRELQKIYVREMYLEKLSQNQISRVTGMSKKTIIKAVHDIDPEQLSERLSIKFHEMDESSFDYETEEEIW